MLVPYAFIRIFFIGNNHKCRKSFLNTKECIKSGGFKYYFSVITKQITDTESPMSVDVAKKIGEGLLLVTSFLGQ